MSAYLIAFVDIHDRARFAPQNWCTSDAYAPLLALRKTPSTTSLVVVPEVSRRVIDRRPEPPPHRAAPS